MILTPGIDYKLIKMELLKTVPAYPDDAIPLLTRYDDIDQALRFQEWRMEELSKSLLNIVSEVRNTLDTLRKEMVHYGG